MTGNLQPLEQQFPVVKPDGTPTEYFIRWAQQRQIDIRSGITLADLAQYLADHMLQAGSGILITPDGNISNAPTIAADVQAILDQISTVQGSILFRGAAGWDELVPGTSGDFLKTLGAGANPEWAAGGGGGGSALEIPVTKPTASQFTLLNAGTATVVDQTYGMTLRCPSTTTNIRFLSVNSIPGSNWVMTIRAQPVGTLSYPSAYHACMIARVSGASGGTAGRILISGLFNSIQFLIQRFNSYTSFNANVLAPVNINTFFPWQQLEKTATNLIFRWSPNGEEFYTYATEAIATFMTGVDEVGVGCMVNGNDANTVFQSFTIV